MSLYCVGAVHRLRVNMQPALTGGFCNFGAYDLHRRRTTARPVSRAPITQLLGLPAARQATGLDSFSPAKRKSCRPLLIAFTRVAIFGTEGRRWGGQWGLPVASALGMNTGGKHYGSLAVVT